MQLPSAYCISNTAFCAYRSTMLLTSTPCSLAMQLKISRISNYFFSTPALKELGKGWSWFIILIVKTRCTCADKMFLVPLEHHQQHVFRPRIIPPIHFCIHPRQIELPSLEKPDESLAPIKRPLENYKWKWKEVPRTQSKHISCCLQS